MTNHGVRSCHQLNRFFCFQAQHPPSLLIFFFRNVSIDSFQHVGEHCILSSGVCSFFPKFQRTKMLKNYAYFLFSFLFPDSVLTIINVLNYSINNSLVKFHRVGGRSIQGSWIFYIASEFERQNFSKHAVGFDFFWISVSIFSFLTLLLPFVKFLLMNFICATGKTKKCSWFSSMTWIWVGQNQRKPQF